MIRTLSVIVPPVGRVLRVISASSTADDLIASIPATWLALLSLNINLPNWLPFDPAALVLLKYSLVLPDPPVIFTSVDVVRIVPSKVRSDSPSNVFAVPAPVITRLSALLFIVVLVTAAQELSPLRNEELLAVPDPSLAVATVPESILDDAIEPLKLDAVTIPDVLILPSLYAVKAIPARGPTPNPSLKVLIPVASTLATSSYVIVPATPKLPDIVTLLLKFPVEELRGPVVTIPLNNAFVEECIYYVEATHVNEEPTQTKLEEVTIPVTSKPVELPVTAEPTTTVAAVTPTSWTSVVPVLKLVAVAIPLDTKLGQVIPGLIPDSVTWVILLPNAIILSVLLLFSLLSYLSNA